ncbi:LptM family lipoprotein [Peribacillus frigoritolerans]|uniref:LptM family lipoprotein n=1 Tax=Peribacillus frigoritolerans TaxID=450367 RepID=UPI0037F9481E
MKKILLILAAIFLVTGLSACKGGQEENQESPPISEKPSDNPKQTDGQDEDTPGESVDDPAKDRPNTKTDIIILEGMEESFQFTLHHSQALGFSTYIVDDMVVEEASSGEGDAMIVFANFAGKRNGDAKVQIFFNSEGTNATIEEKKEFAREVVISNDFEIKQRSDNSPNRFDWSEVEFDITQKGNNYSILGTVSVFQHGDRVYYAIVQYPEDYEEGFIPRVVKMFDDIVWYEGP